MGLEPVVYRDGATPGWSFCGKRSAAVRRDRHILATCADPGEARVNGQRSIVSRWLSEG